MNNDSDYIAILCGCFPDKYIPLTRSEFWKLYHKYGDSVKGIIESGEERVQSLLERSGSISFSMNNLNDMGIKISTFCDEAFPQKLLLTLKDFCPPLLYMCGNFHLNEMRFAGYVGSRNIDQRDSDWTKNRVVKNLMEGFGIVSGGAKGIDSISIDCALENDGNVIAYLPDNILAWARDKRYRKYIEDGRLLLYSHVSPYAPKTKTSFVAAAMERNKLIYAQSSATAVVRSDYKKGGTWAGAVEALKHKWSPVFVWDNKNYDGNQKLIDMGGIPLSDDGIRVNGDLDLNNYTGSEDIHKTSDDLNVEQISLFDYLESFNKSEEG